MLGTDEQPRKEVALMRERLIELLRCAARNIKELKKGSFVENLAELLMDNGVVVLPSEIVWQIEDKNAKIAFVIPVKVEDLPLFVIKDLKKYGYYTSKEAAAKAALKGGAE